MGFLDFIFPKYCVNCRKLGEYICPNCFAFLSFDVSPICLVCNRPSFNGLTHPVCKGRYTIDGVFSSIAYKGIAKKLIYNFKYKPYLTDLKTVLGDLFYEGLIQNEEFSRILQGSEIGCLKVPARNAFRIANACGENCNGEWKKENRSKFPVSNFNNNFPFSNNKFPILVPIPLHCSRLKSRGYNQAEILAKELIKRFCKAEFSSGAEFKITTMNALERVKNTKTQVGLKREERQGNIKGAFSIKKDFPFFCYPEFISGSKNKNDWIPKQVRDDKDKHVLLVDDVLTTGSTLLEAANVLKRNGVKKVWGVTLAKD